MQVVFKKNISMKQMLQVVLFGLTFILMSCVKPSYEMALAKSQIKNIWSSHFVFPNKPNVISYQFFNPRINFDAPERVEINMSCNGDSVDIFVKRTHYEWGPSPVSSKEESRRISYSCSKFNELVNRLASLKPEKCNSRNAYSTNSDVSSSIYFMDEANVLRHISYNSRLCSFGRNEKERTPLESVDYDLRKFITDAGAWENLVIDRPLVMVENPNAMEFSKVSAAKVFDKRFTDKSQSFYWN